VLAGRPGLRIPGDTTEAVRPDQDQRLKVLRKEFFESFLICFFPTWAARFDCRELTRLDKAIFLAPPQGEKRQLDLVVRLPIRDGAPLPQPGLTERLALVPIETESRDSVQPFPSAWHPFSPPDIKSTNPQLGVRVREQNRGDCG
jgi:hypothetical protein